MRKIKPKECKDLSSKKSNLDAIELKKSIRNIINKNNEPNEIKKKLCLLLSSGSV